MKYLRLYILMAILGAVWAAPKKVTETVSSSTIKPLTKTEVIAASPIKSLDKVKTNQPRLIKDAISGLNNLVTGLSIITGNGYASDTYGGYPLCSINGLRPEYGHHSRSIGLDGKGTSLDYIFNKDTRGGNVPSINCIVLSPGKQYGYGGYGGHGANGGGGIHSYSLPYPQLQSFPQPFPLRPPGPIPIPIPITINKDVEVDETDDDDGESHDRHHGNYGGQFPGAIPIPIGGAGSPVFLPQPIYPQYGFGGGYGGSGNYPFAQPLQYPGGYFGLRRDFSGRSLNESEKPNTKDDQKDDDSNDEIKKKEDIKLNSS